MKIRLFVPEEKNLENHNLMQVKFSWSEKIYKVELQVFSETSNEWRPLSVQFEDWGEVRLT